LYCKGEWGREEGSGDAEKTSHPSVRHCEGKRQKKTRIRTRTSAGSRPFVQKKGIGKRQRENFKGLFGGGGLWAGWEKGSPEEGKRGFYRTPSWDRGGAGGAWKERVQTLGQKEKGGFWGPPQCAKTNKRSRRRERGQQNQKVFCPFASGKGIPDCVLKGGLTGGGGKGERGEENAEGCTQGSKVKKTSLNCITGCILIRDVCTFWG